jgi:hypothetical protein
MKKNLFFVAAAMCVVTICAHAQNTVVKEVINLDGNGQSELRAFFAQHPTDTVKAVIVGKIAKEAGVENKEVKLYHSSDGQVCYLPVTVTPAPATTTSTSKVKTTAKVEKVEKTENDGRKVTFENGDTMSFKRTTVGDIPTKQGVDIINGDLEAVDPKDKNFRGESQHQTQFAMFVGANYVGCFAPQATFLVGQELCDWLLQVVGDVSRSELGKTAKYAGAHYTTLSVQGKLGYKFWKSLKLDNYLAVVAIGGYGFQETDKRDDEDYNRSSNYGLVVGLGLQSVIALNSRWAIALEAGWKLYPSVDHGVDEVQKFSNQGAYAQIGLMFRIP